MTNDPAEPWSSEVRPYLAKLAEHIEERGPCDHSISVPMGEVRILVTPLEQRLAIESAGDSAVRPLRRHALVRDGLGLQVKIHADRRSLNRADAVERSELLHCLRRSIDVGHQLLRAMGREMNRLTDAGKLETAREYQDYRNRLTEAVRMAERELHGEAQDDRPQPSEAPTAVAPRPDPRPARREPEEVEEPAVRSPAVPLGTPADRAKVWAAAGLCVVLTVVLIVLWLTRDRELVSLTIRDFATITGVEQVICRPPELLLVFSQGVWETMEEEAKRRAAAVAGEVAGSAGYRRVILRTWRQPLLAEWNRGDIVVHQ